LKAKYPEERVLGISVFSGEGLDALSRAFSELVVKMDAAEASTE